MTLRREESSGQIGATQAPAMHLVRNGVGFGLRTLGMLPVLVLVCIVFQLLNDRFFRCRTFRSSRSRHRSTSCSQPA